MAIAITTENFEEIKSSSLPVVIDFWAEWCGPCRMIGPLVEELAEEFEGRAIIGKCDVDTNDAIATEFAIRNIPTVIFLKNGEIVDKQVGATSKAALKEKLEKLF